MVGGPLLDYCQLKGVCCRTNTSHMLQYTPTDLDAINEAPHYLGSKQKAIWPSFTNVLRVSVAGGSLLGLSYDINVTEHGGQKSIRCLTTGCPSPPVSLTLLFCFSSDSSWPSGRLGLRVGWMQTTLLSQEGGPTGGSLSSWLSEKSSSSSSVWGWHCWNLCFQQNVCCYFL